MKDEVELNLRNDNHKATVNDSLETGGERVQIRLEGPVF